MKGWKDIKAVRFEFEFTSYKGSKTSLHKHTGNLVENLFSKKSAFKLFTTFDIKVFV